MKRIGFLILCAGLIAGCDDDSNNGKAGAPMGTLRISAREAGTPYSGFLEVYPCTDGTSTYYGNYRGDPPVLSAVNASYLVTGGVAEPGKGLPVLLPLGRTFTMVYWGYTFPADTAVSYPAVRNPQLSLSADLSQQAFSLRQYPNDTVCHSVNNFVFATKDVEIGTGSIDVELERVVAGISITLHPKDDIPFAAAIDTMSVLVGSIAESLDLYTAEPSNPTKTVLIPLRFAPDRMSAYNSVVVFPSGDAPQIVIRMILDNGEEKTYTSRLSGPLTAGNMLTLHVNIGEILSSPSGGNGFEVSKWHESSETINTGPI